jgi:hypothetical protein
VRPGASRPRKGEIRERKNQGDNVSGDVTLNSRGNPRGNSVDYIVARLRREGHDDLVEAIANRKLSAFACACLLGWRQRPLTIHGENCNQARRRAFDVKSLIG